MLCIGTIWDECKNRYQKQVSQLGDENDRLDKESRSYKSDVNNRTECHGGYKYKFAVIVNQMASIATVPELRLAAVIRLAFSFLPVSLHINGMLPRMPCANTIVMENIMVVNIFDNDKNYDIDMAIVINASTIDTQKWSIYRSDRLNKSPKCPQLTNYLRENISKLKLAQGS